MTTKSIADFDEVTDIQDDDVTVIQRGNSNKKIRTNLLQSYLSFHLVTASAGSGVTQFTLPSSVTDIRLVQINGLVQSTSSYSLSGTTLTFDETVPDGAEIILYHIT